MNYLFIILGIFLVVVLYFLYTYLFPSKSKVTSKNYLAKGLQNVPFEKLENPSSSKYSIEIWVFVNTLNGMKPDTSVSAGKTNNPTGCIFEVPNNYHLDLFEDTSLAFYNNGTATDPAIVIPNFPLQRWVYVVISVDNSLIDLYLDGKLVRSIKTNYVGKVPNVNDFFTFGNGDIYIAGMNRIPNSSNTNTVFKNYMQGNASMKLPIYSVSLDFLKNSKVSKNISIM